ncbi:MULTISPECIES: cold adaptation protein AtcA [Rheinheimera]|jgi:hypothetical protein|uniref:Uncharacterized protein n=1 Tax=Rheinheimera tilapiae TaxID=875043 RepID=A0ABV6B7R2_9GAMM
MTKKLNIQKINQLKTDAYENIDSYNDPDTPKALEQFSAKIKAILQADPEMLESVPEYLPVALFGRVKFSKEAKLKWAKWVQTATLPAWDEFKVTVAFNNADLPLVKTVRDYSETLLIESCAVLYLLEQQGKAPARSRNSSSEDQDDEPGYEEDYDSDDRDEADDDYNGNGRDDDEDEEGYDDAYDDIRFKGEGR